MDFLFKMKKFYILAIVLVLLILIPSLIFVANFTKEYDERQEKIGFIILGDVHISGWNKSHYQGIKKACQNFDVELIARYNVQENSGQCTAAIKDLAAKNVGMIFLASYAYAREVQNLVEAYPHISFATNSAEVHARNMTSYFARMYQARYLAGALAGMKTKSNVIGYVAAMSNTEVNRGINAFTLGVQKVNPDAKVVVMWTNSWQNEAVEALHAQRLIEEAGADVLTYHQDEEAVGIVAEKFGVDFIAYNAILSGYSSHYLASIVCRWDLYYSDMIQRYLKGELNSIKNHWIGFERGAVMLSNYSAAVSDEMISRIEILRQEVLNNRLIFSGTIYDNQGNIRCREGEAISDDTLLEDVNWLVEGVEILD